MTETSPRVAEATISEGRTDDSPGHLSEKIVLDEGVTHSQLLLCKPWLLQLAAAAALPASTAGKAGSSHKVLRCFHDGTSWETPPAPISSGCSWYQAKGGTALQLCVQGKETVVLSLPCTRRYVFKQQLQEAGHDLYPEPCCAFANVMKGFDTAINYK